MPCGVEKCSSLSKHKTPTKTNQKKVVKLGGTS
jgi:hypothetical protein